MKIVILDAKMLGMADHFFEPFRGLGEVKVYESTKEEHMVERIEDAEAVLVTDLDIGESVMEQCPHLKYIGILATGMDMVDVKAAKKHGITVTNVKDYSTKAVSQFAFSLLLEICNLVKAHDMAVHSGEWKRRGSWCFWLDDQICLEGKTLGIIGYGNIGKESAKKALAFGMKVVVYSPHRIQQDKENVRQTSLEELYALSDVIMLHCPLTEKTKGIICKETIAQMKHGVIIINNARGKLINSKDLAEALNSGKIYGAGLDVAEEEPILDSDVLLSAKNCIITPHISWAAKEAREKLIRGAYENLVEYLKNTDKEVHHANIIRRRL